MQVSIKRAVFFLLRVAEKGTPETMTTQKDSK